MSQKARKTPSRSPRNVRGTSSEQRRPRLPVVVALGVAALLIVAVGGLLLSSGESPAAAVAANADRASVPIVAATPTAVARVAQPAAAVPTQPAIAAPAADEPARIAVTAQDGVVQLAVADVSDGKAHFYTYESAGKTIPFFVLKSSDGVVRAAFDACDVCFPAQLGYHQEGDVMVCNNCGSRFPSVRINIETGGCNPAPLADQTAGAVLTIEVARLEAGAKYF